MRQLAALIVLALAAALLAAPCDAGGQASALVRPDSRRIALQRHLFGKALQS